MQSVSKRMLVWGVVASASLALAPASFQRPAFGDAYEDVVQQLNDTDRQLRDEDARFAQETAGMNKGGRVFKQAQDRHQATMKELQNRKAKLKTQAENTRNKTGVAAVAGKLENNGDAMANE